MAKKFNPNNRLERRRLNNAREWSRRRLRPFRENRYAAIQQMVGAHYSESGSEDRVPVNLLLLAAEIYTRHLAARRPAVLADTVHDRLKPQALDFEIVMDHALEEIKFGLSLERWAMDAILGHAVMKVGITQTGSDIEGFLHDAGQPFADVIDLDDWNHDMTVKRWEQIAFAENRYTLPLDYVKGSDLYTNTDTVEALDEDNTTNETGEPTVATLGRGDDGGKEEYQDTITCWDTWLPREQLLITTVASPDGGVSEKPPIRVVEWKGPEVGPFHRLSYQEVPNNVMPLPPVAMLMDIHDLANRLFRKLGRQAERQKKLTGFRPAAGTDIEKINVTKDGDGIRLDDPGGAKEIMFGGPDQVNMAFFMQLRDLYVWLGGNLDALGGLSVQAPTLGQEEILGAGAGARIIKWQDRTEEATREVVEAIGDYVWHDPLRDDRFMREIPDTGIEVPVVFNDQVKEGDFGDFNLRLQPYSMQGRTPAERLGMILQSIERIYMPLAPVLAEQGVVLDAHKTFEIIAKYGQIPEINEILIRAQPTAKQERGPQDTRQAPNTTRTNVRVNRSQANRKGQDSTVINALLGAAKQPNEMNSALKG
jgi:hypothetical protein